MPRKKLTRSRFILAASVLGLIFFSVVLLVFLKKDNIYWKDAPMSKVQEQKISAWITEWQWVSGLDDMQQLGDRIDSLQMFAAYFNEQDQLYFTKEMNEAMPQILNITGNNGLTDVTLTVVNDRFDGQGKVVQKDPELVTRLVATKESRKQHIDQLVDAVNRHGFGGLEIDYEQISNKDWKNVCLFYKELYARLDGEGKTLRIVLEPKTKIGSVPLPKGPQYVMMAYNLYGTHSGPGPKADFNLITDLAKKMKKLSGEPVIALSLGGFDWSAAGDVKALTEKQASKLVQSSLSIPVRDQDSGSLHFKYKDENGNQHTVWYADEETLSQWMNAAAKAGISNIALWRLGEVGDSTLNKLNP
ncbi:putative sporulation-specific glycosylase YdhD [compost metagenome]